MAHQRILYRSQVFVANAALNQKTELAALWAWNLANSLSREFPITYSGPRQR
jgi:hypothetical protein